MRIPRIYHPDLLMVDQAVPLTADASNHLANVLRLKPGHPVVLFNGDANEYSAELIEVEKRRVVAMVDAKLSISLESPLPIHLAQAVSRGDRMEWVIQKSVELGVQEITPVLSERCGVKLPAQRWQKKLNQWHKIMVGACEQCGRNTLPILNPVMPINEWLKASTGQLKLTLHPTAERRLRDLMPPTAGVRLLIGPEGGFSEQEVYTTEQIGFQSVSLGPRVLRTETAALTALAALQSLFGDL